ncbi:MAG TPA: hypothetical protein VHQ65_05115 [Thermoanaerobaculia bacterium]|nr:hypothetical protein [Thermoanaerobaculia bacterium]
MRSRPRQRAASASLLALALLAAPVLAQEPAEPQRQEPAASEPAGPDIDAILEGDEEVLFGGGGYSYDPGGRRDPFKSLLDARERPELDGPRPEGVPGLLIDEVAVTGIFRTPRGRVAQVQASDKDKSYLIREGDDLYDGDVVSIGANEVVFKQIVQDPTALKPFREVVKKLSP